MFEGLRATATDAQGRTSELSLERIPVPEPVPRLGLLFGGLVLASARRSEGVR